MLNQKLSTVINFFIIRYFRFKQISKSYTSDIYLYPYRTNFNKLKFLDNIFPFPKKKKSNKTHRIIQINIKTKSLRNLITVNIDKRQT